MFFFFKQKTAYEMRISDWSSDVCSSDLIDLVLDPPDMEVPCWIVHEISQIISEATANAVRHGGATHVCVTLTRSRGELEFCISDNGSGMQKAGSPRRPQSLTARVADLGGRLTIRRFAPGLDLRIDLPLETELR